MVLQQPREVTVISHASGSLMSVYIWSPLGRVEGWTSYNSVEVDRETFAAETKNIVTEADLFTYMMEREKAIAVQVASNHVQRKAM